MRLDGVLAPAKVNLFLHVVGRRPDGYHLLQSAFALIDWCDELDFVRREDGQIHRHDVGAALPAQDLVWRAAQALQAASATPWGVDITLRKRIPTQAGLSGGSSDAASTLLALNALWELNWPLARLLPLGLALGADVPFFLHGHNAWVEGIGEQVTPLALPPARLLVIQPGVGLETARIFRDPGLTRDTKPVTMSVFAAAREGLAFGHNDLQAVAQALCPEIGAVLAWLEQRGLRGRMSGSGTAVFAQVPDGVAIEPPPSPWTSRLCSIMTEHPWSARSNTGSRSVA